MAMKTTQQLTKQEQIARVKSQKAVTIRTAEGRSAPARSQAAASRLMKSFHAGARESR